MVEKLEEILPEALSYLASEAVKARKCKKNDRAKEPFIAFKILSKGI